MQEMTAKVLENSQDYFEAQVNTVCNNLSRLSLGAYEVGDQIEVLKDSQQSSYQLVINIEQQSQFILQRQEAMRRRLSNFTGLKLEKNLSNLSKKTFRTGKSN
jgi:hypothetical protein